MSFRMPKAVGPASFPQKIGIIGDLGQVISENVNFITLLLQCVSFWPDAGGSLLTRLL